MQSSTQYSDSQIFWGQLQRSDGCIKCKKLCFSTVAVVALTAITLAALIIAAQNGATSVAKIMPSSQVSPYASYFLLGGGVVILIIDMIALVAFIRRERQRLYTQEELIARGADTEARNLSLFEKLDRSQYWLHTIPASGIHPSLDVFYLRHPNGETEMRALRDPFDSHFYRLRLANVGYQDGNALWNASPTTYPEHFVQALFPLVVGQAQDKRDSLMEIGYLRESVQGDNGEIHILHLRTTTLYFRTSEALENTLKSVYPHHIDQEQLIQTIRESEEMKNPLFCVLKENPYFYWPFTVSVDEQTYACQAFYTPATGTIDVRFAGTRASSRSALSEWKDVEIGTYSPSQMEALVPQEASQRHYLNHTPYPGFYSDFSLPILQKYSSYINGRTGMFVVREGEKITYYKTIQDFENTLPSSHYHEIVPRLVEDHLRDYASFSHALNAFFCPEFEGYYHQESRSGLWGGTNCFVHAVVFQKNQKREIRYFPTPESAKMLTDILSAESCLDWDEVKNACESTNRERVSCIAYPEEVRVRDRMVRVLIWKNERDQIQFSPHPSQERYHTFLIEQKLRPYYPSEISGGEILLDQDFISIPFLQANQFLVDQFFTKKEYPTQTIYSITTENGVYYFSDQQEFKQEIARLGEHLNWEEAGAQEAAEKYWDQHSSLLKKDNQVLLIRHKYIWIVISRNSEGKLYYHCCYSDDAKNDYLDNNKLEVVIPKAG